MDFISIIKRNKILFFIAIQIKKVQYFFLFRILFNIKRFIRVLDLQPSSPYEKMKELKNVHEGERCFIIATGPSLSIQDLEKLNNEKTFSMNSICLLEEDTNWRPTYYGIQDMGVYNSLKDQITQFCKDVQGVLIGDNLAKKIDFSKDNYVFPINFLNHMLEHRKYHSKFSDNAYSVVYSGYSITYSLLQIAVYMGFKQIYLIGADCNYPINMKHHFKEYSYVDPSFSEAHDRMIAAYKVAKKYTETHNVKIYNATRGGMLEVFERVNLDNVLSEGKTVKAASE